MSWPRTQTQRSLTSLWILRTRILRTRILRRLSTLTQKSPISRSIQRTSSKSFWQLIQMTRKCLSSTLQRRQTRETTSEGSEQDA